MYVYYIKYTRTYVTRSGEMFARNCCQVSRSPFNNNSNNNNEIRLRWKSEEGGAT